MPEIPPLITGSEKLTSIFGQWPSFHDAEVQDLHFHRGHKDASSERHRSPYLTATLHIWLMTNVVDENGYLDRKNHTQVTMQFRDLDEDLKLEGFNHQNVIFGLDIEQKTREDGTTPYFAVEFEPCYGMYAIFACRQIEILEAIPCDDQGSPLP
jgi:Immunity protein 50